MQRVLRADPEMPLHAMNHIFSPWMLLILLIAPVLLAWRFIGTKQTTLPASTVYTPSHPSHPSYPSHLLPSAGLIALAAVFFTVAVYWDPPGQRKKRPGNSRRTTFRMGTDHETIRHEMVRRAKAVRRRVGLQLRPSLPLSRSVLRHVAALAERQDRRRGAG